MDMVMFSEDWDKYPHYTVDLDCKNPHFLRYCSTLKAMGIKNHHFPLQLHDRDLKGVNPRDPNLPSDIRDKVTLEVANNFFYALREVLVAPGSSLETPLWFELNRANMFLYWTHFNGVNPYIVLIRQGGKSYAMDVKLVWSYELRLLACQGAIITKDDGLRSSNMERIRKIGNEIPGWLRGRTQKDAANSEVYRIPMRENFIRAWVGAASPENADKICRGQTDTDQNWDEIAYLQNFQISLPGASAAGARARWDAELRGDPYGSMFGTTAGPRYTRDGKYAYEMMLDAATWSENLMDLKDREAFHQAVRNQSRRKDLLIFGSFLHNQIGRSDQWLQDTMRACRSFGEDAEKDFGNKWLSGGLTSPFSGNIAEVMAKSVVKEYDTTINKDGYALRHYSGPNQYLHFHKRNCGVAGLDTSDAIGRDDIGLIVTDSKTGATTVAGDFNKTSIFNFSEFLAEYLLCNPKVVLVPEARASGRSVIDNISAILLREGVNPFTRIFNVVFQNPERYSRVFEDCKNTYSVKVNYGSLKKFLGFGTTGAGEYSRDMLFGSTLTSWSTHCANTAHDDKLVKQALGLEIKDGRLDHSARGHDDLLVAKLLSHWFLINGKNLELYGLHPSDILTAVRNNETMSESERFSSFVATQYKTRLEAIKELAEKESDPVIYSRLENQLAALHTLLKSTDSSVVLSQAEFLESVRNRNPYLG